MRSIRTFRLLLEPQLAAHAEEMFAVLSDPAIYEFENEPPPSLEWLQQRFQKLESRRSGDGTQWWLNWVVRLSDSRAIGYVQATVYPDRTALIAYEFNSAYWGKGFAREAVEALLRELADSYHVITAGAVFKRTNHRSRKLLERLGMKPAAASQFPGELASEDEDAAAKPL